MKQNKLTELSIEDLKQKEQTLKIVLGMFVGVLIILVGVLIFIIVKNGITPLIAVPIALIPVLLYSKKNLDAIKTEIESRK